MLIDKTEALLVVHGKGARRVRQASLSDKDPAVPLQSEHWPGERLRLVAKYRHLGGLLHHKGLLQVELKSRIGQAWQAYQARRRQIFAQRQVP